MVFTLPPELRTDRLVLHALRAADAADQAAAVTASAEELRHWLPWCTGPQSEAEAHENIVAAVAAREAGTGFEYAIRRDGEFIGRIGVHRVDQSVPKGEIGYWQATRRTGEGYMTEAATALREAMVAAGCRRIEIRCDARNVRSARVAERAGFTLDARFVNDAVSILDPAELRDTLVYAVTA